MPSSLILVSALIAAPCTWRRLRWRRRGHPARARCGQSGILRSGSRDDIRLVAFEADEEERRAVPVSAPDDGVHVERPTIGWTEVELGGLADLQRLVDPKLGAHRAEVHGLQLSRAVLQPQDHGP